MLEQLEVLVTEMLPELDAYAAIEVIGHTDSRQTPLGNEQLSILRAEAVSEFLVGRGVPPDIVHTTGKGAREPIDPASNKAAWKKNRRIEIRVTCRS